MGETIITKTDDVASDAVADLSKEVGATTNEVTHHATEIAQHTEKLASVEGDAEWTKQRIASLESLITSGPIADAESLRSEVADLRNQLLSLTEKLSTPLAESTENIGTNETEPPPPTVNRAEEKKLTGPFASVRKQLHRLL